ANLSEADRRLRLQALAAGNSQLGRPLPALFFLYRLLMISGGGSEELLREAHALLRDRLSDADLAEAAFLFGGTPIGEDARLQSALRAFSRGDRTEARRLAAEVVRSPVPFPFRRDALLLLERLASDLELERTIGVILPLSGRYGTFGTLVRRGMELAEQVHHDGTVRFVFVDSNADPERSARAVTELAAAERVLAIAGPLTGAASAAAAAQAQQERVPLLTLSQRDGLPETGDFVFRNSLTARLQAQTMAQYAVERGVTRFGILLPDNNMGKEMAELFAQEVVRRGGRVVAQQSYAENATDFRAQVEMLLGVAPGTAAERKPRPPFEALFIPDYADRVCLITPQLVYYGLEGVQLLGINGWNSPELLRGSNTFVEGAVFPDGFFRASPDPLVKEFVHLYTEKHGEEPSILEAQGFDAAGILLTLLADPQVRTREALRDALSRLSGYSGVTGSTSFNPLGEAEKRLFLLQVQDGNIVPAY
ncbi:MAG: penicillin-binding protein activator, partial [Desulfuromonadales bacterium]|nr:penicillin-binding protein activator [Desulfuromonadales bacterium]